MSLSNLIVNIYQNIININGSDILILTDNDNKIWFAFRQIIDILDYKNIRKEMKRIEIDKKEIISLEQLLDKMPNKNKIDYTNKLQPTLKMISEAGLFILLNKSRKPYAEKLKTEIFTKVLPSIRKTGDYKSDKKDKIKLKKLTKKLELIQKEQSMKRLTSKKYTEYKNSSGKGFIYVLKVKTLKDGKEKHCLKLGYATNLNKRLDTYKTGHPDIELVHQENVNVSKKQLEKCVLNLNIMKRLSSKNEIICDSPLKNIINEIQDCKKLLMKYSHQNNNKTKNNKTKKNIKIKV
jgi:prophage antirepressor-like protein